MCPKCGSDTILNYWNDEGKDENLCHECGHKWEVEDA